ncbi:hypothetical protein ES703_122859 [subsurface metagenome]
MALLRTSHPQGGDLYWGNAGYGYMGIALVVRKSGKGALWRIVPVDGSHSVFSRRFWHLFLRSVSGFWCFCCRVTD